MKHEHADGHGHHSAKFDPSSHRRHRHRHRSELFDHGEPHLLLLAMIAERPRHGYELIKAIEDRFGGTYAPSPGVIYPTLSWLEDMGYILMATEDSGHRRYGITAEGEAFLAASRAAVDELLSRTGRFGSGMEMPETVLRAMANLKLAMRHRFRQGPLDRPAAEAIAAALDAAAQTVARSREHHPATEHFHHHV